MSSNNNWVFRNNEDDDDGVGDNITTSQSDQVFKPANIGSDEVIIDLPSSDNGDGVVGGNPMISTQNPIVDDSSVFKSTLSSNNIKFLPTIVGILGIVFVLVTLALFAGEAGIAIVQNQLNSVQDASIVALQAKNTAQDTALSLLQESTNTSIASLQSGQTSQDDAISSLQTSQAAQDGVIASVQTALQSINVTELEAQILLLRSYLNQDGTLNLTSILIYVQQSSFGTDVTTLQSNITSLAERYAIIAAAVLANGGRVDTLNETMQAFILETRNMFLATNQTIYDLDSQARERLRLIELDLIEIRALIANLTTVQGLNLTAILASLTTIEIQLAAHNESITRTIADIASAKARVDYAHNRIDTIELDIQRLAANVTAQLNDLYGKFYNVSTSILEIFGTLVGLRTDVNTNYARTNTLNETLIAQGLSTPTLAQFLELRTNVSAFTTRMDQIEVTTNALVQDYTTLLAQFTTLGTNECNHCMDPC